VEGGDGRCERSNTTWSWLPDREARDHVAEQLTDGPIGVGTRFRAEISSLRRTVPMVTELTAYQRPRRNSSGTPAGRRA
jgi:hypothetical protein